MPTPTYQTVTLWNQDPKLDADYPARIAKLNTMLQQGKLCAYGATETLEDGKYKVTRPEWLDQAAAQEWLDYCVTTMNYSSGSLQPLAS